MKYFPLIWAALWRKPADFLLTLLSVTAAFALFGIMIGFNASVERIVNGAFPDRINVNSRFGNGADAPADLGGGWVVPLAYRDQILRLPGIANIGYRGGISVYYRDPKNQMVVYMVDEGWCRTLPEFQPGGAASHCGRVARDLKDVRESPRGRQSARFQSSAVHPGEPAMNGAV